MKDDIIIRFCEVLSVEDDQAGLRIKVRLDPEDCDCLYTKDLPYCFPLLPKHIHINPKVGECVMVILTSQGNAKGNRLFIGPVISQQYNLNYDPYQFQSRCLLKGSISKPYPDPKMNADNDGTVPDREDIVLQGRQNCDVVLKDNELRLRCGFKKTPSSTDYNQCLNFNREDLAYIQMKYKKTNDNNNKEFASSINLVADRINLLSHDSRTNFTLNDRQDLITEDEMRNILENAHPLVYGDDLVTFLKKLVEVIRTHTHPFSMDPPSFTTPQNTVLSQDLDELLSQSVRIN